MKAKDILEKLIDKAHGYSWRLSGSLRRKPHGKPGELIAALPEEERAALQGLTSDDTQDARRDVLTYMIGTYNESTVTVHTHSIKKEE